MTTKDDVIKAVSENHIWINAFQLVNPTDELAQQIGYTVIRWLKQRDNLLSKYNGDLSCESESIQETIQKMADLTPVLYMSVNAS